VSCLYCLLATLVDDPFSFFASSFGCRLVVVKAKPPTAFKDAPREEYVDTRQCRRGTSCEDG
jgi:hypothetical protein